MKRLALSLSLVLGFAIWAGAQEHPEQDTHPPAGVVVTQEAGAGLVEANVRGTILDWAALEQSDGSRAIYLLATTEDDPSESRSLFRVELKPPGLVALATDLPKTLDRLTAIDADGDVEPELLVGQPGYIYRAHGLDPADFALVPVASALGLDLGADIPVRATSQSSASLYLPSSGLMRSLVREDDGGWQLRNLTPLVTRASRHNYGLRLATPPSTLLSLADGEVLAVGPEAVGTRRLSSLLLPAAGDSPDETEIWCQLPGSERIQRSWFHRLDGQPVLVVTTNSADKLGIFERQQMRLFTLYGDRTRAGAGPWLSAKTTSRRWQQVEPFIADIDGDGDEDLVVAQVDGLGGGKIHLEAFVNTSSTGRRGFDPRTRSTTVEQPSAGWHFGSDLTGDGLADLVLLTEGRLEVYPLLATGSRRLIDRRPRWSFSGADIPREDNSSVTLDSGGVVVTDERPDTTGRPEVLDLDGDGRGELILAENPQWGFGRLRIVFLPPLE